MPEYAAYLRQIRENCYLPQLAVVEKALSNQAGLRTLYRPRNDYHGMTSLIAGHHYNGYDELTVDTTTLDQYLDESEDRPVGFIKCDVEGHELEVLRGGERMLREDQPVLLLECEDHRNGGGQLERVTSYLSQLGYHGFRLFPHGTWPLEECRDEMSRLRLGIDGWRNFGFLPEALAASEAGSCARESRWARAA